MFWVGIGMLLVAVRPTTMEYAHLDFCGHMLQHLLIGMLAPLGLVLARPISLLLRSVPKTTGRSISRFLHSTPLQLRSSPWVATVLNVGAMCVLYLTPLYAARSEEHTSELQSLGHLVYRLLHEKKNQMSSQAAL